MNSCLYRGLLVHHRARPVRHRFRYRVGLFCLDLGELPELDRSLRLFGVNRRNLLSFRDDDHLQGGPGDTAALLRRFLLSEGIEVDGRILLLTQCRMLGYVFNPVSFFYCHDSAGELRSIVAEVNNTFGERHLYALSDRNRLASDSPGSRRYTAGKAMHVSPFLSMDAKYEFRFAPPGASLAVSIREMEAGRPVLDAAIRGERVELSDAALVRLLLAYPLQTLRVTAAIHWQALRLYRKGVPFHRQPAPSPEQREQLRRLGKEIST
ncbi:MAG: DUF1365 domain-containing protein [Candidatus Binatia bacterium]